MSDLIPFKSGMDVVEYGQTAIEEIDDIQDLKNIDIKANALREVARQAREPKEVWNALFSVASHCRRKAGSILADPEFERAQQGDNQYGSNTLLLADLGVDKMEASRWMALSSIPIEKWDVFHRETEILTFTGLYNLARRNIEPPIIQDKYDVIVLDPPWPGRKIERIVRPNQEREYDYNESSIEEIQKLKLPVSNNCHVFMWITVKLLPHGFELFQSWNVKYIFQMIWHKPGGYQPTGLPQYNYEPILYGRIGNPIFIDTKNFFLCFNAPRGKHSEKPDFFYEMIERTTQGKRIDMFARRKIEGFEGWGIEYPNE